MPLEDLRVISVLILIIAFFALIFGHPVFTIILAVIATLVALAA